MKYTTLTSYKCTVQRHEAHSRWCSTLTAIRLQEFFLVFPNMALSNDS